MERMAVIATRHEDWPKITEIIRDSPGVEAETKTMDKPEWDLVFEGMDGSLEPVLQKIKKQTPDSVCLGIRQFSLLMFTHDGEDGLFDEISQHFRVNIGDGHLSENGRHISIEDTKETLKKIQAFLALKGIPASLH